MGRARAGWRSLFGLICGVLDNEELLEFAFSLHCSHLPLAIAGLGRGAGEILSHLTALEHGCGARSEGRSHRALPVPGKPPSPARQGGGRGGERPQVSPATPPPPPPPLGARASPARLASPACPWVAAAPSPPKVFLF